MHEPHIDSRTMEIHVVAHAGYTSKLNAAIEGRIRREVY